jgi:hypothetical protein
VKISHGLICLRLTILVRGLGFRWRPLAVVEEAEGGARR